jgi:hypothetical protein
MRGSLFASAKGVSLRQESYNNNDNITNKNRSDKNHSVGLEFLAFLERFYPLLILCKLSLEVDHLCARKSHWHLVVIYNQESMSSPFLLFSCTWKA